MGDSDDGVFTVVFAAVIFAIIGLSAVLIDLGSLRLDRSTDRSATDSAALAGAATLASTGPQAACTAAMGYAMSSLNVVGTPDCSAFPLTSVSCPASAVESDLVVSTLTVRVRWPIPDTDSAMTNPDVRPGTRTQAVTAADGAACSRVAVSISRSRSATFGQLVGSNGATTTSSSVALAANTGAAAQGDTLAVLDPTSCNAISMSGGSSLMIGHAPTANSAGLFAAGKIAIDSDGTGSGCTGSQYIIGVSGSSWMRAADGYYTGGGVGPWAAIYSYALNSGATNVFPPSATTGCVHGVIPVGTLCPAPVTTSARVAQTPFNNAYNCLLSNGCLNASGTTKAYINQWTAFAPTAPYTAYTYSGCSTANNGVTVIAGDAVVNCPGGLSVHNTLVFTGNHVVFTGGVNFSGSGCMIVGGNSFVTALNAAAVCASPSVALAGYSTNQETEIYIAGGVTTSSNNQLIAPQTFLYIKNLLNLGGSTYITAPFGSGVSGVPCTPGTASVPPTPSCFINLAIWDDYTTTNNTHNLSGNGNFTIEGAVYLPNGALNFSGSSSGNQTGAQLIAKRLTLSGGSTLTLLPMPARDVPSSTSVTALIR